MIDEKKKAEIKIEAKKILDSFAKKLDSVRFKERKEKKELGGFRKEVQGMKGSEGFRRRMFENAPNKNEDCIIAEKKEW